MLECRRRTDFNMCKLNLNIFKKTTETMQITPLQYILNE